MLFLTQSASVSIRVGPFVDKTDAVTEITSAVTPVFELSKNHGAFATRTATAISYDSNGWYAVTLDTTDTGTLGPLIIKSDSSGTYLPVWKEFIVVTSNVYNSLVAGTALLNVSTSAMAAGTITSAAFATDAITETIISSGVGSEIATAVWVANISGIFGATAAGNYIQTIQNRVDVNTSTRASSAGVATWSAAASSFTDPNTMGGRQNYLDVAVSSRLASASFVTPPTSAQNAAAVWTYDVSPLFGGGQAGGYMQRVDVTLSTRATSANAATAVWSSSASSYSDAATMGGRIFNYLDVAVSSRLGSGSFVTPPTSAQNASAVWSEAVRSLTTIVTAMLVSGTHTGVTIPIVTSLTNPVVASSVTSVVTASVTGSVVASSVTSPVTAFVTNAVSAIVSGAVTLASGTHTGAIIPTVTSITNPVTAVVTNTVNAIVSGTVILAAGTHTGAIIPNVTSVASANLNLAQTIPATGNVTESVGDALNAARADGFGKWVLSGTTLTLYAADGTTIVRTFTLNSATAPTSRT